MLWELIFVERQFLGIYFRRKRLLQNIRKKFSAKITRYTVSTTMYSSMMSPFLDDFIKIEID